MWSARVLFSYYFDPRGQVHLWHSAAACIRQAAFARLLFAFRRYCRGVDRGRGLSPHAGSFVSAPLRNAFTTWEAARRERRAAEEHAVATIRSWRGSLRRVLNTWKCSMARAAHRRMLLLRWTKHEVCRMWWRWSVAYVNRTIRLRVSVMRWLEAVLARTINSWVALARARARALRALARGLAAFMHSKQVLAPSPSPSRMPSLLDAHPLGDPCPCGRGA